LPSVGRLKMLTRSKAQNDSKETAERFFTVRSQHSRNGDVIRRAFG
jgi:hypothetical protein